MPSKKINHKKTAVDVAPSEQEAQQAPVVTIVDNIIFHGISTKASDIVIEPFEDKIRLRYRIENSLQEAPFAIPKSLYNAVVSRLKTMAKCNIAETRLPHDGKIPIKYENKSYDLRLSAVPTAYGESIVIRILDRGGVLPPLSQLFSPYNLERFESAFRKPNGLILISSPTGHGKSTTLFSALNTLNTPDRRIITVEDPIEHYLEGVVQIQTNKEIGLDFARALRAVMRQNADVIMVSDIRDKETVQMAIEVVLTGHLVLSPMYANNASNCLVRLMDMGIEPSHIVETMVMTTSQRLLITLCSECKEPAELTDEDLKLFETHNIDTSNLQLFDRNPKGCKTCDGSGFKGKTLISEILVMDDRIRGMVLRRASPHEIMEAARQGGMRTLREDGLYQAAQGKVSISEALRTTQEVILDPRDLRIAELESDLAVKNQQLEMQVKEIEAARQAAEKELQDAHDMQMSLIPKTAPPIEGLEITGRCVAANTVGGDFFDYLPSQRKSEIGIVIADVSGKAMKGAMNAVMTDGILHAIMKVETLHATSLLSPASLLTELNDVLQERIEREMNVTMIIGKIDVQAKTLTLANAAHHAYPLLVRNGEIQSLKARGLPLGMKAGIKYREEQFLLQSGDLIILMTDGIIEAKGRGEAFGSNASPLLYAESGRLEQRLLQFTPDMPAEAMLEAILDDVIAFGGERTSREDDMTVVVAKVR